MAKWTKQELFQRDGYHGLRLSGSVGLEMLLPRAAGDLPPGTKVLWTDPDGWMRVAKTVAVLARPVVRGGGQRAQRRRRAHARQRMTLSAFVKVTANDTTAVTDTQMERAAACLA
jgi:hypothetical protein